MRLTSKGWPRALALQNFRYHRYDIDYDIIGHVIDPDFSNLLISGSSTLSSSLNVSGQSTLNNVNILGNLNVNGTTTIIDTVINNTSMIS